MTSAEDNLWRDRSYATYNLTHYLPLHFRSDDDVTLIIDYARQAEVTSALGDLTSMAASRGDNVGIDETTYELELFSSAEIFTAKWESVHGRQRQGDIAAFIIIAPSTKAGTFDPCLADLHVIRSDEVTDVTYGELVSQAVQLVRQLDIGYTDCWTTVSTSCDNLIRTLRRAGFTTYLTMPRSINMVGCGLTDVVWMAISLRIDDRQPRTADDVLVMLKRRGVADDADFQQETEPPQVAFLPQQCKLECGLVINVRGLRKDEYELTWKMLFDCVERGEGFALHKYPNVDVFRHVIRRNQVVVCEESATGKIIAWFTICNSVHVRSNTSGHVESLFVTDKSFQDRGMGSELSIVSKAIMKELGYHQLIIRCFIVNVRAMSIGTKMKWKTLGVIPKSGYVVGHGWTSVLVLLIDLSVYPTFTQIVQRSPTH